MRDGRDDSGYIAHFASAHMDRVSMPLVIRIFLSFFKVGWFAFGGGYAILPLYEAELAERRKWVEHEEILDVYAVGQSVPGVIAINTATLLGYRVGGRLGGLAAAFGVMLPAFLVILFVAAVLPRFKEYRAVRAALMGIRPAVAALVLRAAIRLGKRSLLDWFTWVLAGTAAALMLFTPVHPALLIGSAAVLGVAVYLSWRTGSERILRLEENCS
jgi:chromate transporter